jgi:hypothetical protein
MKNAWKYIAGAAAVGLVAFGMIMRKRVSGLKQKPAKRFICLVGLTAIFSISQRAAAEAELGSGHSLSGSVNNRAAFLVGGGAAAVAGAGTALPKFLTVPSMRRTPSGIEVDNDGAVLEQSASNYYEMEGAVDASELPEGVDISPSGTLNPYMV